jgi:hypothetical protein
MNNLPQAADYTPAELAATGDGELQTNPKAVRDLDFTVVAGYLRGEHRCPFELHATGCRDLNKLKSLNLFSFNVYADSREAAHAAAVEELGGTAKLTDIWVQPCCTLKRMQAIGRA